MSRYAFRVSLVLLFVIGSACGGSTGEATDVAEVAADGESHAADSETPAGSEGDGEERRTAPDFELPDLAGNPVTMASLRGKTVIVDFWATWCPPCIFQIPILNAIQEKYGPQGVVVIGVAVDVEGLEVVKPYTEENGVAYTILIGDESLARKFGAPGFPAMAIVDPEGKIDSMHVGLIEEEELTAEIEKIQARRS